MGGGRNVAQSLKHVALSNAPRFLRQPLGSPIADVYVGRARLVAIFLCREVVATTEPALPRAQCDRVIQGLHHEWHHHPSTPANRPESLQPSQWMQSDGAHPLERPCQAVAAPYQHRVEEADEVDIGTIGKELDVSILIDVHAAACGDVAPCLAVLRQAHSEN